MVIDFSQYPHSLYYQQTAEATQDSTGSWKPGQAEWVYFGPCRLERNGQALSIPTADGKTFVFSGTIYMPRNTEIKPLPIGTRVIVTRTRAESDSDPNTAEILIDKPNATFETGRLHNRMWV